jgi:hypothetical protein
MGDPVRAGTLNFKNQSEQTTQARFDVEPSTENNLVLTGIEVGSRTGYKSLSQKLYIDRLKYVPAASTFEDMCTVRSKLA